MREVSVFDRTSDCIRQDFFERRVALVKIKAFKSVLELSLLLSALFCGLLANAQNRLSEIRAKGEIVIATDATYPPFEFMEKGKLQGFDIDLGNEIGKELGVRVKWTPLPWSSVLGALETGKCDLVMSGMTITKERKEKGYGFSRPYFLSGQAIAKRKGDARIQTLQDLKDKISSVQEDTTGQFALDKLGVPKSQILKFDQLQDGLLNLRNGKSDAVVADLPALQYQLKRSYSELEIQGGVFSYEYLGIASKKGETPLVSALNLALEHIMTDGRYSRIYQTWLPEPVTTGLIAGLDKARDEGTPAPNLTSFAKADQYVPAANSTSSSIAFRWDILNEGKSLLLRGAGMTLLLTFLTLLIGTPSGLLIALARISKIPFLKQICVFYVEIVRGTPLLMQIYVIYFVLPAIGINIPSFLAGVIALSLNAAAYISEIFRAGIESIDTGQMEAARALGMSYREAMRWVILPQTLRRTLPPLTNEAAALLKDSSLVSVVALSELMREGKELATTSGSATTVYLAVAVIYLAMTLPLTYLVRRLEDAWKPVSKI